MSATIASGYIYKSWTPPSAPPPLTMACWAKVANATQETLLMSLCDFDATNYYYLEINEAKVIAGVTFPGLAEIATVSANTWTHCAGVFESGTSRYAYLNGTQSTQSTTSKTPPNLDTLVVGNLRLGNQWYDNKTRTMAEAAVWYAALTQAEITSLAKGVSPLKIRPQNLVAYWPLVREGGCLVQGAPTGTSNVTAADHPRIYAAL